MAGLAFAFLQTATPAETTTSAGGETTVYLAPEQMAEIAQMGQSNVAFMAGYLAFALIALAGIFVRSTGA